MHEAHVLTHLSIAACTLFLLCVGPYRNLRRDDFRTDVRRIRDRLFDFMWKNGYDFQNPSYRRVRQMLNGMLRLSNTMTPLGYLVVMCLTHARAHKLMLIDEPDRGLSEELNRAVQRASSRMIKFLFMEGLTGWAVRVLLATLRAMHAVRKIKAIVLNNVENILAEAYKFGSPILSSEMQHCVRNE